MTEAEKNIILKQDDVSDHLVVEGLAHKWPLKDSLDAPTVGEAQWRAIQKAAEQKK